MPPSALHENFFLVSFEKCWRTKRTTRCRAWRRRGPRLTGSFISLSNSVSIFRHSSSELATVSTAPNNKKLYFDLQDLVQPDTAEATVSISVALIKNVCEAPP